MGDSSAVIDKLKLKVELVRQGSTFAKLARQLKRPPTTLASWLSGAHPPPPDLAALIAEALGIEEATITTLGADKETNGN